MNTNNQNPDQNNEPLQTGGERAVTSIDFSKAAKLSEILEPDVSVGYINAMFGVARTFRSKDDLERIVDETTKKVYDQAVEGKVIEFDRFQQHLKSPGNFVNILIYHLFGELIREELKLESDEFYESVGFFGVINDPVFGDNVGRNSVADILWGLSVFNRGKNSVTDVREIGTTKVVEKGVTYRCSLAERVIEPHYLNRLLQWFPPESVNQLLKNDFSATIGAYKAVAEAKETTCEISIVPKDYELERTEKLLGVKKKIYSMFIKYKDKISEKAPFLTLDKYQEPKYTENTLNLEVPAYMKYLVKYPLTEGAMKSKRKKQTWAERMEIGFVHNLRSLRLQKELGEQFRVRAEELEQHLRYVQAQQDGFGHDVGNGVAVLEMAANNVKFEIGQATLNSDTGRYELNPEVYDKLVRRVKILSNNASTLRQSTQANRLLLAGREEQILSEARPLDLKQLIMEQVPSEVEVYNAKLEESKANSAVPELEEYNPITYSFEFDSTAQYTTNINEGLFRSALTNGLRNAIRKLESTAKPHIKVSGRVSSKVSSKVDGEVSDKVDEQNLEIVISDNGLGASPEIIESIRSGKEIITGQGISRGLDRIRKTMQIHGGSMDVDSQPGKGFSLYLRLPIHQSNANTNYNNEDEYYMG